MFEDMTYDSILSIMLSNVSDDIDKREGSIIFDALSPIALEFADIFASLGIVLDNGFADTAEREYLIRIASERGIYPTEATNAVLRGEFDTEIQIGARFGIGDLTYAVTEKEGDYIYKLKCETAGIVGHSQLGKIIPLENITGLTKAELTEVLVYGEDAEDTEAFRERFFESINNPAYQGNKSQYKQWVKAIDGVGQCKVIRTPEGGGTVGVVVTSSENTEPSAELVASVKNTLDPTVSEGLGEGMAPVGHIVSVTGAEPLAVTINIDWQLAASADEADVTVQANTVIKEYIDNINATWEDKEQLSIGSYQLIAKLADISDIADITSITFNGDNRTLTAEANQIFNFEALVIKGGS